MEGRLHRWGFRTLPQHPAPAPLPGNWLMLIYVKGNVANSKSWLENKKELTDRISARAIPAKAEALMTLFPLKGLADTW